MIKEKLEELKSLLNDQVKTAIVMLELNKQMLEKIESNKKEIDSELEPLIERINIYEEKINVLEMEINNICIMTLALFQPEAKFLRIVVGVLQMNQVIERIGDISINISENLSSIYHDTLTESISKDLYSIISKTIEMLHDSLVSFQTRDTSLAKSVYERDDEVDDLRDKILNKAISLLKTEKQENIIEGLVKIIHIAKDVERIADLSTAITKNIIYINKGKRLAH